MENPKLRHNIQIAPYENKGTKGFLLSDTLFSKKSLFIGEAALGLLSLLDGKRSVKEILDYISLKTGQSLSPQEIQSFIDLLDQNMFLENDAYQKMMAKKISDYKSNVSRPCLMAGNGYPEGKEELRNWMDKVFQRAASPSDFFPPEEIQGIVVPHIDIERGGETYARTYGILKKSEVSETYVILGVNHSYPSQNPFIITDRNYETPLGTLYHDQKLFEEVKENIGWDPQEDELAHAGEHSIEFPALFLSYLYPGKKIKILSVLCNFQDKVDPRVTAFIWALKPCLERRQGKVTVIASVDFSHIGPQFGWPKKVESADTDAVEERDRGTLKLLAENRPDDFFEDIEKEKNDRGIDALGPCYVFQRVLEGTKGQLVEYRQAFDPDCTVTFAGLIF